MPYGPRRTNAIGGSQHEVGCDRRGNHRSLRHGYIGTEVLHTLQTGSCPSSVVRAPFKSLPYRLQSNMVCPEIRADPGGLQATLVRLRPRKRSVTVLAARRKDKLAAKEGCSG